MGGHGGIEVAKTVLEVADLAWTAVEFGHHHHHQLHENQNQEPANNETKRTLSIDEEVESLRSENRHLRNLLETNLELLRNLSESPCVLQDCPPDLYARLAAAVDSDDFLARLKSLQAKETGVEFPFKEYTGDDMHTVEILVKVDQKEPSRWVWVTEDMVPGKVEERSGIDDEKYVVVTEDHVVDGVADFMAKCIVSNPKSQNLTPEQLQKSLAKALGGVSKLEKVLGIWHAGTLFYTLSTWGLALTGLYKTRAVLRLATMGVHTTSKVILKAL